MMEPNTDWTGIAHTDRGALPTAYQKVRNVMAVKVHDASIRNATVCGVFEVNDPSKAITTQKDGTQCIEVKCLWYGRKPPKTWMHLKLTGRFELIQKHTGKVVSNISG